jgi:hypothetical protein
MRGIEHFNFPAFHEAARELRALGVGVWSPAERDEHDPTIPSNETLEALGYDWSEGTQTFAYYMAHDLKAVCECDAVVVLPGWEASRGARLEVHVAREVGHPVYSFPDLEPIPAHDDTPAQASTYAESHNPKRHAGSKKAPLHFVPPAGSIHEAEAFAQGADKYGAYNWREIPVDVMTYVGAIRRHLDAFADGEDCAPDSGVHHLGHIRACCNIVLDCLGLGTLIDNRPPAGPAPRLLAERDQSTTTHEREVA